MREPCRSSACTRSRTRVGTGACQRSASASLPAVFAGPLLLRVELVAPARFAYLVLAHQRPQQLRLLLEAIGDPRDLILLHVDFKSLLHLKSERNGIWSTARALARRHPNVVLMRPRCTNWGGWSLSQILLD